MKCKCGHSPDDHIEDDDFSCCVGAIVDSTVLPSLHVGGVSPGYTTYEPCPCKAYKPEQIPQRVN